ncbi:putative Juvenile hormone-inducible protein 26 [Daphnia magna]|uniref:Putative Juvenile hormone-inducible protein 26 n=1 Tax=Daphnia magna TaxID=35525 RepID=A0A164S5Z3_9CRUS|nr:putative Juvenile hormone-inducible protein 26 [Daphnia magna]
MSVDVSDESSITAEWLESILHLYYSTNGRDLLDGPKDDEVDNGDVVIRKDEAGQTISVKQFQVRPGCDEGENLLSDLLAIDVTVCRNGSMPEEELHLMAKLLSQDPFCRHFILEAGFDVREIHFYTTLMPALTQFCGGHGGGHEPWPVPSCFYAKYRQGSDSVLVLDNMKASGFHVTEFHLGLSLDQAIAAARSIARIHASVLAYRLRLGVDLGQAFPFLFRPEAAAESYQQLLERGLPQLATFLHTADRPELHAVLTKLHKMRPRAKETIANLLRPASPIATLTHTDFWCNNLLFAAKRQTAPRQPLAMTRQTIAEPRQSSVPFSTGRWPPTAGRPTI